MGESKKALLIRAIEEITDERIIRSIYLFTLHFHPKNKIKSEIKKE